MFCLNTKLFILFLFTGCFNYVPCTIALTSEITKVDQNRTVEIPQQNFTPSSSVYFETEGRIKITPNKSSMVIDKRKLRHSRYPKLDKIFKKISKLDETIPKTADEPDVIAINNYSRSVSQQISTSGSELVDNNYYVSSETSESSSEITESPSDKLLLTPPLNKQTVVFATETQFEESPIDEDEELYDDYEDGDYGDYEEDIGDNVPYILPNHTRLTQEQIDKGLKQYFMALVANGWTSVPKPPRIVSEDQPQNNEDANWVNESQADANVDPTSVRKWIYYGTRAEIEPSRIQTKRNRNDLSTESAYQKANQHYLNMTREGGCKFPQRRIVRVQSLYKDPSKTYMPRCTFLHRCGDDTGCCQPDSWTCVPKHTQQVELYFHTSTVGKFDTTVEKLTFTNHTECECAPKRIEYMVKDETASILSLRPGPSMMGILDIPDGKTEAPMPLKRCICPTEFSVHNLKDGSCECDCFNKQKDCLRIKRGREFFGLRDRQCILNGQCQTPNCEYGEYIDSTGRCPRRNDRRKIYRK